jgi:hypothetical protein
MRMKQPSRAKKPAPLKGAPRFTRALGTPAMIILVVCVSGAAIMMAARPGQTDAPEPARSGPAKKAVASTASAAAPIAIARSESAVAGTAGPESTGTIASAAKTSPVTITGCLEAEQYAFVLKNTAGEDAPKARSWKSGFLKKGAAPIEVVDPSQKLKLATHAGKRVSVTGVLVGREMQVRSLHRVAPSCNQKS